MEKAVSTSITRRTAVAGLALTAAPLALAGADHAYAQDKQANPDKSLTSAWAVSSPSRRWWITSATPS